MGDLAAGSVEFICPRTDRCESLRTLYAVEMGAALLLLAVLSPVVVLLAIVITILSRRSPLVCHQRVGWRGEELGVLKFRTMWDRNAPAGALQLIEDLPRTTHVSKTQNDDRVQSRFAAFCRRYSLDEIPQLVHVASGRMSFVGPRPITRGELDMYYGSDAAEVLSLRPGLTGLWQTMGRNRLSYSQRRRLDVWLVRRASPRLSFAILLRTIPRVVRGDGAY